MHENCLERSEYNLLTVIISGELDRDRWLNEVSEYCFAFYVLCSTFLQQACINLVIKIRGKQNKMKKLLSLQSAGSFYCFLFNLSLPPTNSG